MSRTNFLHFPVKLTSISTSPHKTLVHKIRNKLENMTSKLIIFYKCVYSIGKKLCSIFYNGNLNVQCCQGQGNQTGREDDGVGGQLKKAGKDIVVRSCGTQAEEQDEPNPPMNLKLPSAPGMRS